MSSVFRNILKMLAVAVACLSATALAQGMKNLGYVLTTSGAVVISGKGECVRSGSWTPALAAAAEACKQCTPDLCPKPVAKKKPEAKKPEAKKPEAKPKPKLVRQNVELKIELQGIAFNKTELTADNKKELDAFLAKQVNPLMKAPNNIGAVIITGHTDRIGSEKYNKTLSEKRALGVKDYVVGKGVDQKLIFWEGKGLKQPIPVTKFCTSKMSRKALIECLAPNRRVTVEVVGTRMVPAKPAAKKPEAKKPEAKKPEAKPETKK